MFANLTISLANRKNITSYLVSQVRSRKQGLQIGVVVLAGCPKFAGTCLHVKWTLLLLFTHGISPQIQRHIVLNRVVLEAVLPESTSPRLHKKLAELLARILWKRTNNMLSRSCLPPSHLKGHCKPGRWMKSYWGSRKICRSQRRFQRRQRWLWWWHRRWRGG